VQSKPRVHRSTEPPRDSTPAIDVEHLTKRYAGRTVVDDLTLSVRSGEVFAILGENGAGKSTTIEMLEGFRQPDYGDARVLGLDPWRQGDQLRPRIGLMLQEGGFYPSTSPREIVRLYASFFERPIDPDALIRQVGLKEVERTRYRRLSGGEKQRLSLAVALIGQPELVFLDEPTAGMDPRARRATWDVVRGLRAKGVTVVLTTHLIDEAESLADRVAIIDSGRLIALGSPSELTGRADTSQVILTLTEPVPLESFLRLPTVASARIDNSGEVILEARSIPDLLVELTTWLRSIGCVPRGIRVGGGTLEDVFLQLTGKDLDA
jgi:ABC-2 type transport system ATP-binding protein